LLYHFEKEDTVAAVKHAPVVAVYSDRGKAEAAVDELWHAGIPKDQVGFAIPGEGWHQASTATERIEANAAEGALIGSITGGTLGAVAGALAVATIPGLGAVIVGGLLAGMVGGAAAGAALGAFAGPFAAMGFSEEETQAYESELRAGRTIVVVQPEERGDEVLNILRSHGATQIKSGGW
jgi:hypothetical protein